MMDTKNLESQYRKWLYIQYRFHPETEEAESRRIAFRNFLRQIAHHCRSEGYDTDLFQKAREIKDKVYPVLIFDFSCFPLQSNTKSPE